MLDSNSEGCEFKTRTGHDSFSKLRQFRLPYFASVYSAANEYKHCLEGTCDGLVSRPGELVQLHSKLLRTTETRFKHWPYKPSWLPKA